MLEKSWKHNASLWFFSGLRDPRFRLLAVLGYNQTSGVHSIRNIDNILLQYHQQHHYIMFSLSPLGHTVHFPKPWQDKRSHHPSIQLVNPPKGFDMMLQQKTHADTGGEETTQNCIHFGLHQAVVLHPNKNAGKSKKLTSSLAQKHLQEKSSWKTLKIFAPSHLLFLL